MNVSNTESLPNGWHVDPYSLPCRVSPIISFPILYLSSGLMNRSQKQVYIDLLATQFQESPDNSVLHVYPVIPMCMVSIHADADTSLHLSMLFQLKG